MFHIKPPSATASTATKRFRVRVQYGRRHFSSLTTTNTALVRKIQGGVTRTMVKSHSNWIRGHVRTIRTRLCPLFRFAALLLSASALLYIFLALYIRSFPPIHTVSPRTGPAGRALDGSSLRTTFHPILPKYDTFSLWFWQPWRLVRDRKLYNSNRSVFEVLFGSRDDGRRHETRCGFRSRL